MLAPVDHTHNIVECENVSFSYGKEAVLSGVTFNIHQGDYLGIIGPNGGGKSTLLKLLTGLLQPSYGVIKLFGTPLSDFRDYWKIGYVPQRIAGFDPNFPSTVLEVVLMGSFAKRGLFKPVSLADKNAAQSALQRVGMEEYADRLIGDLSGGQQQRVFIARALTSGPELLFLDEPTTGIDEQAREQFYALLRRLNQEECLSLVLVSHDQEAIFRDATEIATVHRRLDYQVNYPNA